MAVSDADKQYLTKEQQDKIQKATDYGNSTGDWDTAHAMAESIRATAGYSGGTSGTGYIPNQSGGSSKKESEYDLSAQIKKQQAANVQSLLAGLKNAYQRNMNTYDAELDKLPETYAAAKNNVASQDSIARSNFNERAAATGLNSGTSGQAELARSSATRAGLAGLDRDEAQARNNIELAKANLRSDYETAIAQAKADGDTALANALYQEMIRVQNLERADAANAEAEAQRAQELALKYGLADPTGLASIRSLDDLAALGATTDPVPTYTGTVPTSDPLPELETDGTTLRQYVNNLLSNAYPANIVSGLIPKDTSPKGAASGVSDTVQGVRNFFTALGGKPKTAGTKDLGGFINIAKDYKADYGEDQAVAYIFSRVEMGALTPTEAQYVASMI